MGSLQSGKYRITNVESSLRLDYKGDGETTVYAGPANTGYHQIWELTSVSDAVYTVQCELNGAKYALDGNTSGQIYALPPNGGKFQQWRIVPNGSFFRITSQATELRLDSVEGYSVQGKAPTDSDCQNWVIVSVK